MVARDLWDGADSVSASGFDDELEAGVWWPRDRAWIVCTEIDFPWTFVAGSPEAIERLDADDRLETIAVSFDTPANRPG